MRISTYIWIGVVVAVCAFGWVAEGSWQGAAAWAIICGFVWLIVAWVGHSDKQQAQSVYNVVRGFQTTEDFKDHVESPARRGERLNPDPTRPDEEEMAGLITAYFERKRGQ